MVRIVLLTHGGDYAERVLLRLSARGVSVDGLVIVDPPSVQARLRRARTLRLPPRTIAAGALRRALLRVEGPRLWSGLAREIVHGGPLNSADMLGTLRALAPDYLVLARLYLGPARIGLIDEIVAIPSAGTLNAHPGLLPWARGSGVIEGSIERRIAVGVTVHLVEAGFDTGPILNGACFLSSSGTRSVRSDGRRSSCARDGCGYRLGVFAGTRRYGHRGSVKYFPRTRGRHQTRCDRSSLMWSLASRVSCTRHGELKRETICFLPTLPCHQAAGELASQSSRGAPHDGGNFAN